jgi:hypothetical protein
MCLNFIFYSKINDAIQDIYEKFYVFLTKISSIFFKIVLIFCFFPNLFFIHFISINKKIKNILKKHITPFKDTVLLFVSTRFLNYDPPILR